MKLNEDPPAEISHDAHPAHKLKLVTAADGPPFRYDGCKEPGDGKWRRYRCADGCDFDLHTCCALAEPTLKHPLHGDLEFKLLPAAGEAAAAACSACGDGACGLVYRCAAKKDLSLHPFCAALRMESFLHDGHHAQLCGEAKLRCVVCGEKGRQHIFSGRKLWAYRWCYHGAHRYLHVACMKKIAVQSWEQAYQDSSVLEASVPIMKGVLMQRRSPGDGNSTGEEVTDVGIRVAEVVANAAASASSSSS